MFDVGSTTSSRRKVVCPVLATTDAAAGWFDTSGRRTRRMIGYKPSMI
jgi:hypothetical protein